MAAAVTDAFRLLQSGNADAALQLSRRIALAEPRNARAHMAMGVALRVLGKLMESREALDQALQLDPRDYGAHYEMGATLELLGSASALDYFETAARLRPTFVAAHRAMAGTRIARGEFEGAAQAYEAALACAPADPELPMLLAQVELLLGRLEAGWSHYARRPHRRHYEAQFEQQGARYQVPALADVVGRDVTIVTEQGLGDNLFFLRFAPPLRAAARTLAFVGDERLHPLLRRTNLFDELHSDRAPHSLGDSLPVLLGDLPAIAQGRGQRYAPSLAIAPDEARMHAWEQRLMQAGPRPWLGVTWRSGIETARAARGLAKEVPLKRLFEALAPLEATVIAMQRAPQSGELATASKALARTVHDFSQANDDLEDALAVVALLDRHVGVSNTNMHLAAAAGRSADVLVPFPPEWRWGASGSASEWFPGFRVLRQQAAGDWTQALGELRR